MELYIDLPIETKKDTPMGMDKGSSTMGIGGIGDMLVVAKDVMEGQNNLFKRMVSKVILLKERVNTLNDKVELGDNSLSMAPSIDNADKMLTLIQTVAKDVNTMKLDHEEKIGCLEETIIRFM